MPPIVFKKGIAGQIYGVPVEQSQVLPFRHGEFMQQHTRNLDGIARIVIRGSLRRKYRPYRTKMSGQVKNIVIKAIKLLDFPVLASADLPSGFYSKPVMNDILNRKARIDFDDMDDFMFNRFKFGDDGRAIDIHTTDEKGNPT